jgi:hypothetical protein
MTATAGGSYTDHRRYRSLKVAIEELRRAAPGYRR